MMHNEDDIARLIAKAGRRPAPGADMHESVRLAVEQAWIAQVSARRTRRTLWLSAAAAVTAVAVGLGWFGVRDAGTGSPAQVATFVASRGSAHLNPAIDRGLIVAGSHLLAGTRVHTGRSGFVLVTVASVALTIGPDTALRLDRPGHVLLERGRIYADSGVAGAPPRSLVVDTPYGQVTHLGTQFQVFVRPTAMVVSVRSGVVLVKESNGRSQRIERGQGVDVSRGGAVSRIAVSPYGTGWKWVNSLMPDFPIDGRPLSDFLVWYTRETGIKLVLSDPQTAAAIRNTRLSGSISGLTPAQALAAVMATTRFEYDMTIPGELRIGIRIPADRGT